MKKIPHLTASQATIKLQQIFKGAKINEGFLDPFSIKATDIREVVDSGLYNQVVDWSCVFNTIYKVFRELKNEKDDFHVITTDDAKVLARRTHKFLISLPLEYHFLLPVPKNLQIEKDIKITDKISLVKLNEDAVEEYKTANPESSVRNGGLAQMLARIMEERHIALATPQAGEIFLRISSHGYVGNGECSVYEQDPIYIYKIFFSLNYALGTLERDDNPRNPSVGQLAQFSFRVYTEDKKYASSLTRPDDEAQLINYHKFKDEVNTERLKHIAMLMAPLVKKQDDHVNEKLRNQIINSLFWYFETKKTLNPNLKTVFFTSVFDSFFEQEDRSKDKARMIAMEGSLTAGQQEDARTEMEELYRARNTIIHGERPLLDYHVEGKRLNIDETIRVEFRISRTYRKYLSAKLNRFARSVGLIKGD